VNLLVGHYFLIVDRVCENSSRVVFPFSHVGVVVRIYHLDHPAHNRPGRCSEVDDRRQLSEVVLNIELLLGCHVWVVCKNCGLELIAVSESSEEEFLELRPGLLVGLGDRQHQLDHQEECKNLN